MSDVTIILSQIATGNRAAAEELWRLVYAELRELAASKLAREAPGHTLQPTALVNEAYLRLVGPSASVEPWDSRGHFFAAAAEAMRRILIDAARRKRAAKRNAGERASLTLENLEAPHPSEDLLALDAALERLEAEDAVVAKLVKLRYFAGLTNREAAECLGVSSRTADNYWSYAKAWLLRETRSES